jgi:hypothetical protein
MTAAAPSRPPRQRGRRSGREGFHGLAPRLRAR